MSIILILVPLIILLIIIISVIYSIILYNKLIKLKIVIEKEYSNIDIDLKKRSDLIPKLVEVVKSYMEYEKDTLIRLVDARNKVIDSKDKKEIDNANNEVSSLLKDVFVLAENYPDLQASTTFLSLQEEINKVEEDLTNSRKDYNKGVLNFNNTFMVYPAKLFASILGFKKQEYFKIPEEEKEVPTINFE